MTCCIDITRQQKKTLALILNTLILISKMIYLMEQDKDIEIFTLISTSVFVIEILVLMMMLKYKSIYQSKLLEGLLLIEILLIIENAQINPIFKLLQLVVVNLFFQFRECQTKLNKRVTYGMNITMNCYIFLRLLFQNSAFRVDVVFSIFQTLTYTFLVLSQNQLIQEKTPSSDSAKSSKQNIEPQDEILVSSQRLSQQSNLEFTDEHFFKAFDVLPQGIVIIDKNEKQQFQIRYCNNAVQTQLDSDDQVQLLQLILNLKGYEVLTRAEDYKACFSNQSQNSMRKSSHKYVSRQPPFKLSNTFIHDQICSAGNKFEQNEPSNYHRSPSVQAFLPKRSDVELPKSPSIYFQTPNRQRISEENCLLETLLNQMWGQFMFIYNERHLFSPSIQYVHESDTFVTYFNKSNQKQCIDLKVFTAVHLRSPMLVLILRDVTHRDYIQLLKDYSKQKSKMLSFVSHEFRTPLNCIVSMLEVVIDNNSVSNAQDLTQLKSAIHNCKYILNLSNDLLDLAQIKEGRFKVNHQRFNLKQLLNECLSLFEIQAKRKNLALNFLYDRFIPHEIVNDSNRIRQIVINLLGNALKFTLEGSITLSVSYDHDEICIEVQDTGIGMKDEDQPKLFQAFQKIENKETSQLNAQGVGLGLLISSAIAQQLNTKYKGLGFKSEYQFGSKFCFLIHNFQSQQDDNLENYEDSSDYERDLDTKLNDVRRLSLEFQNKFTISKGNNQCECPQVLIVDDNQFNIDALLTIIGRQFKDTIKIDFTICGFLAQEKVQQRFSKQHQINHDCIPYRLILMDVEMPFQNGIETAKNIRQIYQKHNAKVIIVGCSGNTIETSKDECKVYMDDYVIKPVTKLDVERIFNCYFLIPQ